MRSRGMDTPLHWAAQCGNIDNVKVLLRCDGIEVNKRSARLETPMLVAASACHVDVVKLLASHEDTDINLCDERGRTPFDVAARCPRKNRRREVIEFLASHEDLLVHMTPSFVIHGDMLLHRAVLWEPYIMEMLLQRDDVNVNVRNNRGETPLHLAARFYGSDCMLSSSPEAIAEILKIVVSHEDIDVELLSNAREKPCARNVWEQYLPKQ